MALADDLGGALWSVGKTLHREAKARERARWTGRSYRPPAEHRTTQKEAVFEVLEAALDVATGGGTYTVSARTLYYQVRPRVQDLGVDGLKYDYFSQTLLTQYRDEYGPIPGLTYDPRGTLIEPHSKQTLALGTTEVGQYHLPEHVYNKILYVEKKGLEPVLRAAQFAERYDMAVVYGEGYAVEACRELLASADAGDYRIFALHDADPYGYEICRTLGEATDRMREHYVDVVDLGLTVADAQAKGLGTETFVRNRELSSGLRRRLTEEELAWFDPPVEWSSGRGRSSRTWYCTRVELNAFTAPGLVAYIEEALADAGADEKLIPPSDVARNKAEKAHREAVRTRVENWLAERFDLDQLTDTVVAETKPAVVDAEDVDQWILDGIEEDRAAYWRTTVGHKVGELLDERTDEINGRVRELCRGQIEQLDDDEQPDEGDA